MRPDALQNPADRLPIEEVAVFDFGVAEDGRAYLVMERLRGSSLREELRERGLLEPARAKRMLRDVAAAAALAHQRGLPH